MTDSQWQGLRTKIGANIDKLEKNEKNGGLLHMLQPLGFFNEWIVLTYNLQILADYIVENSKLRKKLEDVVGEYVERLEILAKLRPGDPSVCPPPPFGMNPNPGNPGYWNWSPADPSAPTPADPYLVSCHLPPTPPDPPPKPRPPTPVDPPPKTWPPHFWKYPDRCIPGYWFWSPADQFARPCPPTPPCNYGYWNWCPAHPSAKPCPPTPPFGMNPNPCNPGYWNWSPADSSAKPCPPTPPYGMNPNPCNPGHRNLVMSNSSLPENEDHHI